jgi:DNA polymerase III sliding clamp (beta) subunit (PCNA family)
MEVIVERSALAAGLGQIHWVLKEVDLSSTTRHVAIEVCGDHLMLSATNLEVTLRSKVPLFEIADVKVGNKPVFIVPGKLLREAVDRSNDNSLVLDLQDQTCTVKGKQSFKRILGIPSKDFPALSFGITDGSVIKMSKEIFLRALRSSEEFMGSDASKPQYMNIQVNTMRMEATDGYIVSIFGFGTTLLPKQFIMSGKNVEPVRGILAASPADEIELTVSDVKGRIVVGTDVVEFSVSGAVWKDMDTSVLNPTSDVKRIFTCDKAAIIAAIEEANLFSEENFCIKLEKRGAFLSIASTDAIGNQADVTTPVTWLEDAEFKLLVSWKTLLAVLKVINDEIVNFGVSSYNGRNCIRIEENGVILIVLSIIEKVDNTAAKEVKKKKDAKA